MSWTSTPIRIKSAASSMTAAVVIWYWKDPVSVLTAT